MTTPPGAATTAADPEPPLTVRAFDGQGRLIGPCQERIRPMLLALHLPAETRYTAFKVVVSTVGC